MEKKTFDLILKFESEFDRDFFSGQLSDGWGENFCYTDFNEDGTECRVTFDLENDDLYIHNIKVTLKYGSEDEKRMLEESGIDYKGIKFDGK